MKYENIIFVVGAARSFSSLTAGILHHAGAWGSKDNFPPKPNKQTTFENVELVNDFISAVKVLRKIEFVDSPEILTTCLQSIIPNIFVKHGVPKDRVIFLKHPALIAFEDKTWWTIYESVFPGAKWIVVRRPEEDIRKSHFKEYGKVDFCNSLILEQIPVLTGYFNSQQKPYFEIWPGRELKDPNYTRFKEMVAWAGLEWNEEIENFICPDKHHFDSEKNMEPSSP